ncbi:MAG: DUF2752 domain-containing protein [Spirochaetaceae bacterium]|nr:DUF2752 domain-containing protein [Spirochaetaceae bacterium]
MQNKIAGFLRKNKIFVKFFFILVATFIFYNIPKNYLGDEFPICIFKNIFQRECIGCGTTRAFWSILHLQIREALDYNRLSIITFPLLTCSITHWIFKQKR